MANTPAKTFNPATLYRVEMKRTVYRSTTIGDESPEMDIFSEENITLNLVLPHAKQTPSSKLLPAPASAAARRVDEWIKNNTTERVDYELISLSAESHSNVITVMHL